MPADDVPILAVHGVAASPAVWDPLKRLIPQLRALRRPKTGRLEDEIEWLAEYAAGAVIVGMSGGATLGLALAGMGAACHGFVLHEPAAGNLVPDLLSPTAEAFRRGGTTAVGKALYGRRWSVDLLDDHGDVDATTAKEIAMFRSFQPRRRPVGGPRCVVTTGSRSAAPRHHVARELRRLGYETRTIEGSRHFVTYEQPARLAALVREVAGLDAPGHPGIDDGGSGWARFWW